MGRKIAVMGASCAGKTTLAAQLAERLGVPHIELDALHHLPNWQEATVEELHAKVEAALAGAGDGWAADGNYLGKLDRYVIDQADTVVWLDLPLRVSLRRLWRRTTARIRAGTELWGTGNRETWWNFVVNPAGLLQYTLRSHRRRRREWPKVLGGPRLVRLRSEHEVGDWLVRQGLE
jgi:adenylate kinase family enzyme